MIAPMLWSHFPYEISNENKWEIIRNYRDSLIQSCSWIIERHNQEREMIALGIRENTTVTDDRIIECLLYIQSLRDLPQNTKNPDEVIFTQFV